MNLPKKIAARQHEITADFLKEIDKHLLDIVENRTDRMFEIRDVADIMNIHPRHLSNTIKLTTGKSPCYFFERKILDVAKALLEQNEMTIAAIAALLTYDPSNFTKFFKRFAGQTPSQYREEYLMKQYAEN
ncbi:helix-turn-helix domain-containing protein [Salmonirosea aquatica]|uniref:Helix-turn-helix domain-containing protein n=1 Tax=Salmonirosea aquatica TaxID=2654236 RepID=A0A7C9BJD0_9BACT|nr:helix-turn-helix domain-containing protein [Cytophagaceae bacterium SJW1-29]